LRLIRFGATGSEKPRISDIDGIRRDLSGHILDWNLDFFLNGGLESLTRLVKLNLELLRIVPDAERWASPIARPGKIICIGLNYRDHTTEAGMPIPSEPIIFLKAPNTVSGPYDDIQIPRGGEKTDWEVELGFVIGMEARYLLSPAMAMKHIAGYCIAHDVFRERLST
jgi:2,4-didehydro-3-deoxy-L-rhamnonate hydrolase